MHKLVSCQEIAVVPAPVKLHCSPLPKTAGRISMMKPVLKQPYHKEYYTNAGITAALLFSSSFKMFLFFSDSAILLTPSLAARDRATGACLPLGTSECVYGFQRRADRRSGYRA